jgi:hypothetical protein
MNWRTVDGRKSSFVIVVVLLLLVSLTTLAIAIPETARIDSGCCASGELLAKDFSAYYTAGWRLFHDPAQIYFSGFLGDGEPAILPQPQGYKYLPSFLLLVFPFLAVPYGSALVAFDIFQFALLPLIAFMIYYLLKGKSLAVASVVVALVLVLPIPLPTIHWSISFSYYWQWAEGQCKVLETFLLLSALALARSGRPRSAGVAYAFAAFDPRLAILAAPLMLAYTKDVRTTAIYTAGTLVVSNLALFYPPTFVGFVKMVFTSGALTPPYPYTFVPIIALAALMIVDRDAVISALRGLGWGTVSSSAPEMQK